MDEALLQFNEVLKRLDVYFRDLNSDLEIFRNAAAPSSGRISLFLSKECELFGMTSEVYKGLMLCSKSNKSRFQNLLCAGNFNFEGRADYRTRLLFFTVSDGGERKASHIPEIWLPTPAAEEVVGEKRQLKRGERGPGKKDYATVKTANQLVNQVTESIYNSLEDTFSGYTHSKKSQIIEVVILNLRKYYKLHEDKNVNNEINYKIVNSLKQYLDGLRKFGGKFAQVESTIENVISSISVEKSNSSEMAKLLYVTRRRIISGKERRKIFNNIIEKEENQNKIDESTESSDQSEIDEYYADL